MTFDPAAALAEIRRLYFAATPATIQRDFELAMNLIKSVADENDRQKATVYMHGLAEMRREWSGGKRRGRT